MKRWRALDKNVRRALIVSLLLLVLRLRAVPGLGFGDAEALYACYGLFPQPAYLDHPGLIGALGRLLPGEDAPNPMAAHGLAAFLATLAPWGAGLAAWAGGAPWAAAARSVLCLVLLPELSIGLFGFTPDLLLALLWFLALAPALWLARQPEEQRTSFRTLLVGLALGAALGLGVSAKLSMLLLGLGLLVAAFHPAQRSYFRTSVPYAAAALALLLASPIARWEIQHDFPMFTHRLVTTQTDAGLSLRNLGVLLGGQLLYVGPPHLWGAYVLGRELWQRRKQGNNPVLVAVTLCTLLPLSVLCLWSARAEPHWIAPALLGLAVYAADTECLSRRLAWSALGYGAFVTALAWLSVRTAWFVELASSKTATSLFGEYRPKFDLTNDLYAWGPGRALLSRAHGDTVAQQGRTPAVVAGPHWMLCAQAQAALGRRTRVGCRTAQRTDFDTWYPPAVWHNAPVLLYVQDSRYPVDVEKEFPERRLTGRWRTSVTRAGVHVRSIVISRLEQDVGVAHSAAGTSMRGAWGIKPAARTRSSSAPVSGFGVVSSLSP